MMRFSSLLSTTLAVQNSAPTVGTPPNGVALGVPGGGLAVRALAWAAVSWTPVASAIRDAVQNARVASCAARPTIRTVPVSGLGAGPVGRGAAAGPAASSDAATTSEMAWDTYHC